MIRYTRFLLPTIYGFVHVQPYSLAALRLGAMLYHSEYNRRLDIVLLGYPDDSATPAAIAADILKYQPHIVGFGAYEWNVDLLSSMIPLIKHEHPSPIVILGGRSVTNAGGEFCSKFRHVDFFVRGEGETALKALVGAYMESSGNSLEWMRKAACDIIGVSTIETFSQRMSEIAVQDLTALHSPYEPMRPRPSFYDSVSGSYDYVWIEFNRGCCFSCAFCSFDSMKKGFRPFPFANIHSELCALRERNVKHLYVADPVFGGDEKEAIRILTLLGDDPLTFKMADGCVERTFIHAFFRPELMNEKFCAALVRSRISMVQVGVQTFNPDIEPKLRRNNLPVIRRNLFYLHQYKVPFQIDLIIGFPGENFESIKASIRYTIETVKPLVFRCHTLSVLENTELSRLCSNRGDTWLRFDPSQHGLVLSSFSYDEEELRKMCEYSALSQELYIYLVHHGWLGNEEKYRTINFFDEVYEKVVKMAADDEDGRALVTNKNATMKMRQMHKVLDCLGYPVKKSFHQPSIYGAVPAMAIQRRASRAFMSSQDQDTSNGC